MQLLTPSGGDDASAAHVPAAFSEQGSSQHSVTKIWSQARPGIILRVREGWLGFAGIGGEK